MHEYAMTHSPPLRVPAGFEFGGNLGAFKGGKGAVIFEGPQRTGGLQRREGGLQRRLL